LLQTEAIKAVALSFSGHTAPKYKHLKTVVGVQVLAFALYETKF